MKPRAGTLARFPSGGLLAYADGDEAGGDGGGPGGDRSRGRAQGPGPAGPAARRDDRLRPRLRTAREGGPLRAATAREPRRPHRGRATEGPDTDGSDVIRG